MALGGTWRGASAVERLLEAELLALAAAGGIARGENVQRGGVLLFGHSGAFAALARLVAAVIIHSLSSLSVLFNGEAPLSGTPLPLAGASHLNNKIRQQREWSLDTTGPGTGPSPGTDRYRSGAAPGAGTAGNSFHSAV